MTTIKSYTDLQQSKKLAEILPLESADYFHAPDAGIVVTEPYKLNEGDETVITAYKGAIPCWSLAALINILPEGVIENYYVPNLQKENGKYSIAYGNDELLCIADNPVDACYETIIRLHELNFVVIMDYKEKLKTVTEIEIPVELVDDNVETFATIVKNMTELYSKKNHDYGNSFDEGCDKIGVAYPLGRLLDKMNRLIACMGKEDKMQVNESIEDTLTDLACYSVMTLSYLKRNKNK